MSAVLSQDALSGAIVGDENTVQQILIGIARIEERIKAQAEQSEHRHNGLKMAIETFVPRRELDEKFGAHTARITKLEDDKTWLQRQVWGAWIAGLITVGSLLMKKL